VFFPRQGDKEMAQKRRQQINKTASGNRKPEPSYWKIVAIIAIVFSLGLGIKLVFFPPPAPDITQAQISNSSPGSNYQPASRTGDSISSQVKLVAANFRCACGGCGELFLVDCTCDMPKGAKEEKTFIREQLQKGLSVDQVIQLVDQKYGLRIS
jgi:hypothetical protein